MPPDQAWEQKITKEFEDFVNAQGLGNDQISPAMRLAALEIAAAIDSSPLGAQELLDQVKFLEAPSVEVALVAAALIEPLLIMRGYDQEELELLLLDSTKLWSYIRDIPCDLTPAQILQAGILAVRSRIERKETHTIYMN